MPARILEITDKPPLQAELGNMLRHDGHQVVMADSASEGIRHWGTDHPDLVVLGSELSDEDGHQVVSRMREGEPAGSHTPVILLGSGNDVDSKVRGLRAGADCGDLRAVPC